LASAEDRTPRTACTVAVRTEALRRVGGFTPLRINGEDYDLLYRLGTESGFAWVRAPVTVGYRQHGGSSSRALELSYQGTVYQLEQERLGRYPGGVARRRERLEMLLYNLRHVTQWLLAQRRPDLAWALYRRGLPLHLSVPRWRYMLGFPPWAVATTVRQRVMGTLRAAAPLPAAQQSAEHSTQAATAGRVATAAARAGEHGHHREHLADQARVQPGLEEVEQQR
ncbi:glycosyltransferase family 2 protein, partial [Pyxidicoccus sp. 3LG]